MGSLSIWHWMAVGGIALLLFGGGSRLSNIMGDAARGIKAFREGLAPDGENKENVAPE